MAALAEVFGKQLSGPLADLYWDALKDLAIEQFEAGAKSWIRNGKHFPKPAEILERFQEMTMTQSKPLPELPPRDGKWLGLVNGLFLRYLMRRRAEEGFTGNINLFTRRATCLDLVKFFEAIEAEGDAEATEPQLKIRFERAMARIPDLVARAA
jgi:hypothetical protein